MKKGKFYVNCLSIRGSVYLGNRTLFGTTGQDGAFPIKEIGAALILNIKAVERDLASTREDG